MINCVSDDQVVVNINMGIRNVTWGENASYNRTYGNYFVKVSYKNGDNTFTYQTEEAARALFNKIRDAMMNRNKLKDE